MTPMENNTVLSGPMLMIFVVDAVETLINLGAGLLQLVI